MNNNYNNRGQYEPNNGSYNRSSMNQGNMQRENFNRQRPAQGQRPISHQNRPANGQRPIGQNCSARRQMPRQSYSREPFSWVPLFALLLVIMITVGIICTVVNSRRSTVNADADAPQTNNVEDNASENDNAVSADDGDKKIAVTYASTSPNVIELGASIASDYAILIDLSSNTVVAQKNPDATIFPASMTKIMTLIVAYENCKNLDETFTMTAEITDPLFIAGASVAGFSVGEAVTVRDLLYGAILPSGGDATDALAMHIGGSIEGFVAMMNKKVLQMGLSNTHFKNPSGLHDNDHYSTPHEIAMILQYALQIEECKKILCTYQYTTESTPFHPEGLLLTSTMFSRMAGNESGKATVLGGKTGFTNEGLHCLASLAKVNSTGKEYVLVTAHAPATYDPIFDCINIYKEFFN